MRVGDQLHAPAALPHGRRSSTHCTEGWVGPRAGLDGLEKSRTHRDSIPGHIVGTAVNGFRSCEIFPPLNPYTIAGHVFGPYEAFLA
jgi:hypothetical protein